MTAELIWSFIGIAVSALFGIVGIYLTLKSRYPGKITFVNEQMIELFAAVGNSIDKLAVTYDGKNVDENLVLINGAFINSGRTDIGPSMVEMPITIKLPDGYKWLSAKVVNSAIEANLEIVNERIISIRTGLFRCGEFVRFNALAQVPTDDKSDKSISERLRSAIKFEHRIINTGDINETYVKNKIASKKELKRKGITYLLMYLAAGAVIVSILYMGAPQKIVFPYSVDKNKIEYVQIKTHATNNSVEIKSIESKFTAKSSFEDFINEVEGKPKLEKVKLGETIVILTMMFFQIVFVTFLLGMQIFEYMRNRRILKIFGDS